jgi:hypothetical protein
MAYHTSWYTGDATANTWVQDFSPLVMAPPIPGGDISLWPIIGKLADGREPSKFEWIEEPLAQITLTTAEGLDATTTHITFAAGEIAAAGLRAGALLRNATDRTSREVILVSSVDSATVATVVRDYGGHITGSVASTGVMTGDNVTGTTHTSGDKLEITGYLNFQGSSITNGTYDKFSLTNRSPQFNYYSILDDWTQVSAEDLVREYRGSSPDNWGYQLNKLKERLDRQFEKHLLTSGRVPVGATARSSMGGILWYASKNYGTSGNYVTTAGNFSYEMFDDAMLYLYQQGSLNGGHNLVLLLPPAGVQAASTIHESALRGEYINETVRGLRCTTLMSSITGDRVPLVPCLNMPSDSFMLLNLDSVRVHFLEGMALNVLAKEVGEQMDMYRAARLYSNMTLEFQRPVDNSYYRTGVTFARS